MFLMALFRRIKNYEANFYITNFSNNFIKNTMPRGIFLGIFQNLSFRHYDIENKYISENRK